MSTKQARCFSVLLCLLGGFLIYIELARRYGEGPGAITKLQTPLTKCDQSPDHPHSWHKGCKSLNYYVMHVNLQCILIRGNCYHTAD